ncbi:hypothetical protein FA13DRAFT_1819955 [Coprinellus micaceus]|uniref:N-acetyltransferase domain-containing protein n=1 Tax=Coprinellus micaceus TaxID=71717 RepID=A0A4Y7SGC5_COPMI|nr:hypothetical protein FA13DRAFT_1819955 [Coprinellus micaceus]
MDVRCEAEKEEGGVKSGHGGREQRARLLLEYTIRQLFELSDEQTKSLTKTLGDAFKDEPFTNVVTNGDVEFFGDFHRSTVVAGLLGGEVYVAENANKDIIGVAVWFGPGREMFDSEDQQEQGLSIVLNRFKPEHQEWFGGKIPAEVKHASWHLQTIATAPEYQRKGIARAFVDVMKAKVRNIPLVDEDSQSVSPWSAGIVGLRKLEHSWWLRRLQRRTSDIYEKIGFKRRGEAVTLEGMTGQKFNMWSLSLETVESKALS